MIVRISALVAILAAFAVVPAALAAPAAVGSFEQLPLPDACVSRSATWGCLPATEFRVAADVVASPDGANVYATGYASDSVVSFRRNAAGGLDQIGCVNEQGVGGCLDGEVLRGPAGIAISPDGKHVYVAVAGDSPDTDLEDAVLVFERQPDGTLKEIQCVKEDGGKLCDDGWALEGATGVTVSPDGKNVYVAAEDTDPKASKSDAVTTFVRGPDGKLKQIGCVSEGVLPLCSQGAALGGAVGVAASSDGKNVYVAAGGVPGPGDSDAVVALDRSSVDGTLTWIGCVSEAGAFKCAPGLGLKGASGIDVSPDGTSVYVASLGSGAVVALARAGGGMLTQLQCVVNGGAAGCDATKSLAGAADVAVAPDGSEVYASARQSSAVTAFTRAADGKLAALDCVSEDGTGGVCSDGVALDGANGLDISSSGKSLYVSALVLSKFPEDGAVAVFERPKKDEGGGSGPPPDDGLGGSGGPTDAPPPAAPPASDDSGVATGRPRAPDAGGSLAVTCVAGAIRAVINLRLVRPRYASPFDVRVSAPALGIVRTVRVVPRGRTRIVVRVTLVGACTAPRIVARIDAGNRIREANEHNNTLVARVP